jgi:hypothetical protein
MGVKDKSSVCHWTQTQLFTPYIVCSIRCANNVPGGSSPRGYARVHAVEDRLESLSFMHIKFIIYKKHGHEFIKNMDMNNWLFLRSGARTALPMGGAPVAMVLWLQPGIGSRSLVLWINCYTWLLQLHLLNIQIIAIFCFFSIYFTKSTSDGSSPRGYAQVLLVEDRLEVAYSSKYFNPSAVLNLFQ